MLRVVGSLVLYAALVAPIGAAPFKVLKPESPSKAETTAATELAAYLKRIVPSGEISIGGKSPVVFYVGDTAFAKTNGMPSSAFSDEEWAYRSFSTNVVLNGGGSRGCLYAVYRFLEDRCDVRWWGDSDEDVPTEQSLSFAKLEAGGKPFFAYREIFRDFSSDPKTAVRNRVNANGDRKISAEYGGGFVFGPPYHCHAWDHLLPFKAHGKTHPEWYSLDRRTGKRVGGMIAGQLCLTCPELDKVLADKIEAMIEKGTERAKQNGVPAPLYYDMSMNDNDVHCGCPGCLASEEKNGISGYQLEFGNRVAGRLAKRHPDCLFSVFAYHSSEAVPKTEIRAADNIIVKLCNTKQNMAAGIFEADNRAMFDQVRSWGRHAKNLFVWDYVITFDKLTLGYPVPNEFYIGERIRFFAENGTKGMLIEQENADTSDFYEMKYHILARFLEDPYLDVRTVIEDFARRYYGPAAKPVLALRRYLDDVRRSKGGFVSWFPRTTEFGWLSMSDIAVMDKLWNAAENAVHGDPRLQARVRRSRAGHERLKLAKAKACARIKAAEPGVSDLPFVDCPVEPGVYTIKIPGIKTVDDPESPNGKAIRLPLEDKYNQLPYVMGVYSELLKKSYGGNGWAKTPGAGYHWYDMGAVSLPRVPYFVYLTRGWGVQVGPGLCGMPNCKCRIKTYVKYTDDSVYIARTVFIPENGGGDLFGINGMKELVGDDPWGACVE